jgi:myo-inositol-1(or 4)-monophosphatase
VEPEAIAFALARRIRERTAPLLGDRHSRLVSGVAAGGDPTYTIDRHAERVVEESLAEVDPVAYFTEDAGLVVRGRPRHFFLIDPVDGTRPAALGYETCCVSVAVAPYGDAVTLGELSYGCLVELATGASFEARRGEGVNVEGRTLAPTDRGSIEGMFWAGGFRGQPAIPLATVLAELLDVPGSEGAFFDQGSAAYSLSRIGTGQLDAFVDPGPLILEELPETEPAFRRLGGGHVLNTTTYDAAAGYLLLWELGCPTTDASGRSLEHIPLIGRDGQASHVSTVAASNPELHGAVVDAVGRGVGRLREIAGAILG